LDGWESLAVAGAMGSSRGGRPGPGLGKIGGAAFAVQVPPYRVCQPPDVPDDW
jgi:hypothetical protein